MTNKIRVERGKQKAKADAEALPLVTGEAILLVLIRQANALDSIADNLEKLTVDKLQPKKKAAAMARAQQGPPVGEWG